MPGAGEEQQATGGEGAGRGWARAFGRALASGADESAAGATGSDPGGAGRTGAGTSGLAAGGGAHAMGAASAVAGEGARGTGETEQEELVRALRASRATAGAAGERLPWSVGALPAWRELGGKLREIGGTIRGRTEVLGRFREELEHRQRWERVSLGKAHSEAVREIESKAGGVYRSWMEGAEEWAREAARRDGLSVYYHYRGEDWYRLKRSASEERMEQVREIDGEQAYEKMRRAMEKADQEKARQVERSSKLSARKKPERRGPERGGRIETLAPVAERAHELLCGL